MTSSTASAASATSGRAREHREVDVAEIDAVIVTALADRIAATLAQQPNDRLPAAIALDAQAYGLSEHSVRELLAVIETLTRREVARIRHERSRATA